MVHLEVLLGKAAAKRSAARAGLGLSGGWKWSMFMVVSWGYHGDIMGITGSEKI